jgi:hypothetical protein
MPLLHAFLIVMWFILWVLWFFLLFQIILDIFRSRGLGGRGKAGWPVSTIVLPFLRVLMHPSARDQEKADQDAAQARAQDQAFRASVQQAAPGNGAADEPAKLADLRDHGVISEAGIQQGKEKIHRTAA